MEKLARQVLIVRYFQELISWAQFLYLLIFRKALKSLVHMTSRNILQKNVSVIARIPPSPKSHVYWLPCRPAPPYFLPLWSSFLALSAVLILPQKNLTHTSQIEHFLKSTSESVISMARQTFVYQTCILLIFLWTISHPFEAPGPYPFLLS